MSSAYEVRILRSRSALEGISTDWSTLEQARRDPLLSHRWYAAAAAHLHDDGWLRIIEVRREGRLAAIAPMAQTRRRGGRWLEFIGASVLHEPAGLLTEDPAALARLCDALVAQHRPFVLQRVPDDGVVADALRKGCRGHGRLLTFGSAPCRRVDIKAGWDEYLASRSSDVRSGYRRKRRLLEATGQIVFDSLRPAPAEVAAVLEEAFEIEADGWKGAAGSAMRQNEPLRSFISELANRYAASGNLRINFLRAGGQAVAMNILLEYDRCLWEIKVGFRNSSERASPGLLLLWETIHDAFARGLSGYEFLGSGDGQQPAWATSERHLQTLVYYPYSLRGAWAFGADALMHLLR